MIGPRPVLRREVRLRLAQARAVDSDRVRRALVVLTAARLRGPAVRWTRVPAARAAADRGSDLDRLLLAQALDVRPLARMAEAGHRSL
jgi:hypothetical protein